MQPTSSSFERAALPLTDMSTLVGLFAMHVDYLVGYMSHIRETRRRGDAICFLNFLHVIEIRQGSWLEPCLFRVIPFRRYMYSQTSHQLWAHVQSFAKEGMTVLRQS